MSDVMARAEEAIDEVFSDTSVSVDETRARLKDLQSNIAVKLEALKADERVERDTTSEDVW